MKKDTIDANFTLSLDRMAKKRPDHPVIECDGRAVTYLEFLDLVNRAAANLLFLGVKKGEIVVVVAKTSLEYATVIYSIPRIGAIGHYLSSRLPPSEIEKNVSDMNVGTYLCDDQVKPPSGPRLLRLSQVCGPALQAGGARKRQGQGKRGDSVKVEASDPALFRLSSGTTGRAKHVLFTHGQVGRNNSSRPIVMGIDEQDRGLIVPSLEFGMGRARLFTMAEIGGTAVIVPPTKGRAFVDTLVERKITCAYVTPAHIQDMLSSLPPGGPHLPKTRLFLTGAPLSAQGFEIAKRRLTPSMYNLYATNEVGIISLATPKDLETKPGTVGRPLTGVEVSILDESDQELPRGTMGAIAVRVGDVPRSYHNDPESTKRFFRNQMNFPGDLGYVDDDGYLFLRGRSGDVINNQGAKFGTIEVEEVLATHPDIVEAAVFGCPDQGCGEVAAACVVARKKLTYEEIAKYCAMRLAHYKVPKWVLITRSLPRNPTGKVKKSELKKRLKSLFLKSAKIAAKTRISKTSHRHH